MWCRNIRRSIVRKNGAVMSENLMVGSHKYSTSEYRDNYEEIFGKVKELFDERLSEYVSNSNLVEVEEEESDGE